MKAICRPESCQLNTQSPDLVLLTINTVPLDFEDLLSQYTHKGYRVIACATKYEQKLSWMKVQKMTRADAECDLEFVGFIIFENKLKTETINVVTELNQAGIRNIMCTGDNILTAVSVARECGLINPDEPCFIPHFVEGWSSTILGASIIPNLGMAQIIIIIIIIIIMIQGLLSLGRVSMTRHLSLTKTHFWYAIRSKFFRGSSFDCSNQPLRTPTTVDLSVPGNVYNMHQYSLAVSGDVFRWLVDFGSEFVLRRVGLHSCQSPHVC